MQMETRLLQLNRKQNISETRYHVTRIYVRGASIAKVFFWIDVKLLYELTETRMALWWNHPIANWNQNRLHLPATLLKG